MDSLEGLDAARAFGRVNEVSPEERALVKQIFAKSILLPKSERAEFVHQQADQKAAVIQEVLSLLEHHTDLTLLETMAESQPQSESSRSESRPDAIFADPSQGVDRNLILKEVWEDNSRILRRRLFAIALVLSVLIAFSMLRLFTSTRTDWGYGSRILALAVTLGSAWLLYRRSDLSLKQIRYIELSVMASVGWLAIVVDVRLMLDAAARQDVITMISVHNWNHFVWALIILIYGVFMPNSWQRAAAILFPLSLVPTFVTVFCELLDPQVAKLMELDDYGMPLPVTLIAAAISTYAAHLIHDARIGEIQSRHLSQYSIGRLIGRGGMGRVFEAEHLLLKRPCAIKLIRTELAESQSTLTRFQHEVQATALLTHPHTIQVYDYGITKDDTFFYVMELLPGMNLGDLVKSSGPLPPERAVHFLIQVCGALQEAHASGLIHRDIKPANIFASQRGGIWDFTKLLDFGLVQQVEFGESADSRRLVEGTPGFMSPEQIASPGNVDQRSDLYAVGAVGYFLLTGRPVFVGDSPLDVMLAHINRQPDLPSLYQAGIPADLESIIMRCLAKDPEQRFSSADQLRQSLQACSAAGRWSDKDAAAAWQAMN